MKTGEQREQLLKMAGMWEQLSEERAGLVRKRAELDRAYAEAAATKPAGGP